MHAYGLFGDYLGMTFSTIHRIEPTPVPAFSADVALEAFCRAVRSALEVSQIDFVAIVTRVPLLGVDRLQREQQEGGQNGEEFAH